MKVSRVASIAMALVLTLVLAACGGKASTLTSDLLDEASGIRVEAENAGAEQSISTEDAITVKEGEVIVVSPCMDKGAFHLTITGEDGTVVYDDKAEGRIMYQVAALPGVYDVSVTGDGATGWMTVFAFSADELAAQDEALATTLSDLGIDAEDLTAK